jgi:hypothetical protein
MIKFLLEVIKDNKVEYKINEFYKLDPSHQIYPKLKDIKSCTHRSTV